MYISVEFFCTFGLWAVYFFHFYFAFCEAFIALYVKNTKCFKNPASLSYLFFENRMFKNIYLFQTFSIFL